MPHSLEIFALFMLTGILSTLLLPETKQQTLEELSNEDQEDFVRGMYRRIVFKSLNRLTPYSRNCWKGRGGEWHYRGK